MRINRLFFFSTDSDSMDAVSGIDEEDELYLILRPRLFYLKKLGIKLDRNGKPL